MRKANYYRRPKWWEWIIFLVVIIGMAVAWNVWGW